MSATVTDGSPGSHNIGASLVKVNNNLNVGAAVTGSFSSGIGHVVTIENGIVTNIMPPGGSVPSLNPNYLPNITAQINHISQNVNAVNPCALIQSLVNDIMPDLQIQISAINLNISLLLPIITLPSVNLGAILGWIANFTAPYLQAYLNYIIQLEQMMAAIAQLVTAIETAASRLENCHLTIPPVVSVSV